MRIDVDQLLREPIGTQSSVEFDLGFQHLSDDLDVAGVKGRLKLLRTNEGIWAQGAADVKVDLQCGRCLAPVQQTLRIELDERFVLPPGVPENDEVWVLDADHHLNLQPVLRDLVTISVPMHVVCRPDCKGLCQECGKNLNEGPCDCQVDDVDPRLAALKALIS
jgi:uncharacterized protein